MRFCVLCTLALSASLPLTSQAASSWSNCVSITAVTNEPPNSSILITFSGSGISGCSAAGIPGAIQFAVGQGDITADMMSSLLATSLSALGMNRSVQLYYDNSTTNCYSNSISIGGYLGGC